MGPFVHMGRAGFREGYEERLQVDTAVLLVFSKKKTNTARTNPKLIKMAARGWGETRGRAQEWEPDLCGLPWCVILTLGQVAALLNKVIKHKDSVQLGHKQEQRTQLLIKLGARNLHVSFLKSSILSIGS